MKASQRDSTVRSDKRGTTSAREPRSGTVLLLSADTTLRAQMTKLLYSHNYRVVECAPSQSPSELTQRHLPDLIVIAEAENTDAWTAHLRKLSKSDDCPPIVVFGLIARISSRRGTLSSLFAHLSFDVSPEDQLSVIAAAIRHRKLQRESQILRREAEQLCSDLVSALGETSEKLTKRNAEVRRVEGILRDAEARILRVFS